MKIPRALSAQPLLLVLMIVAAPRPASTADIVLMPPSGGGVTITNAAGNANRFRVADDGTNAFVQGGNAFGAAARIGTTDNHALIFIADEAESLRLVPSRASPALIGGHPANSAEPGASAATIGTSSDAAYPTVSGGMGNVAGDAFATVGGGSRNLALGPAAPSAAV